MPELHQVVQVPLQFFGRTPDARRAGDNAHSARNFERANCLTELVALFALHPSRYAAAAGVVRHEHKVATGQRYVGCERGAFAAAFVLVDLDDQFLALAELFLHPTAAGFFAVVAVAARTGGDLETVSRDFLER